MNTLICFALKEEAAPFRKIAAGNAATAQANISILLTGIGRQNARRSAAFRPLQLPGEQERTITLWTF